jgi:dTDP-4-amino-4,6-dideoxygalactose transaminase
MNIPLTRPYLGDEEKAALAEVLESGWLTQGSRVTDFENAVSRFLGVPHAIACSNCTTALHLALLLFHIGPGDEVIIPSYTWIASANVVRMVGAKPVFTDIDLETFNIIPSTIEAVITRRSRAIMPVHQFGLPADMDAIMDLARKRNLFVIEDAACALGSRYKGKPVGSLGNVTCFSFHPRKVITTGEGGMLVTENSGWAEQARSLLNHGASISDLAKHKANTVESLLAEKFPQVGYNYRMTNLQGALGVIQMQRMNEILEKRRTRAEIYSKTFRDLPYILPPYVPDYASPNWQSYAIRINDDNPAKRDAIVQCLLNAKIACRPAYMACHVQPVYKEVSNPLSLPNTEKALRTVIILPLYPQMTDEEQEYVMEKISAAIKEFG